MALLDAPVVQLWSWPGTGKSGILAALAAEPGSVGLALNDTESAGRWRVALGRAREQGAAWAVLAAPPSAAALHSAARWLPPGLRLAFAGVERAVLPVRTAYVYPPELFLDPVEVQDAWCAGGGGELRLEIAAALRAATDGWLDPVRRIAETGRALGRDLAAEDLLDTEGLGGFFATEVLVALPLFDFVPTGVEDEAALLASGLALGNEEHPRLPHLLSAWLKRRGRIADRRGSPSLGGSVPGVQRAPSGTASQPQGAPGASVATSRPVYRVALFGRPQVERLPPGAAGTEGAAVTIRFPLRRAFQTLAYLASAPDFAASRDELIDGIWTGASAAEVERNFHPTLSHLRRSLAAGITPKIVPLLLSDGIYRLSPEVDWRIDWVELGILVERARFEAAARAETAIDLLRRAWSLYRGSFLPRVDSEWASPRREQAHRTYLELLKSLGDLELERGQPAAALDAYRALLAEDPLEEKVHLAVMRLYASEGRRDLVRRQYDRLCGLLLGELDLEPLDETTREFHQMMA